MQREDKSNDFVKLAHSTGENGTIAVNQKINSEQQPSLFNYKNTFAQKLKEAEVIKLKYIQEQKVLQGNLSNVLPILKSIIEVVHRQTESSKKSETKKDVLMKHPMTVIISIEKESKIVLEFRYLVHLHIITVVIKSVSPEPMSTELVGYEDSPFSNVTTGWPFLWAQKICGLDFLSPIPGEIFDSKNLYKKIPSSMEKTINAICSRLESRNHLYHQMITLEQKINVPPNFAALYPSNVSSQLKKWYPVPWKEILVMNYHIYLNLSHN
ncbi:THO complex subunit 5 B [Trichonephila clavipes]|nr:THO complex subunit 5 B [Trichonephila clavipes]